MHLDICLPLISFTSDMGLSTARTSVSRNSLLARWAAMCRAVSPLRFWAVSKEDPPSLQDASNRRAFSQEGCTAAAQRCKAVIPDMRGRCKISWSRLSAGQASIRAES